MAPLLRNVAGGKLTKGLADLLADLTVAVQKKTARLTDGSLQRSFRRVRSICS